MGFQDWFSLEGKRALITGASRGLGRSMALALAEAGADIVITGRTQNTLDQTADEIRALGRNVWTVKADMGKPEECESACQDVVARLGPVDILVNNLGNREINVSIEKETLADWRQMIDLNLTSCFLGTKIIGGAMLERGKGGRIINIASISALIANRGIGGRDYETGKAAVLHFTRCAAADWAPHGITVNAICPGLFMTDINREWNEKHPEVIDAFVQNVPMGRPGEPHEIGPLAVFLASPAAAYVTGAAYTIDGGYTLW
ncbi:SDR family oxidoreductase [Rhizobium sp. P38BS-XIX]|uniref:SDR family NAD(P)-dependent oxidoreductase n=1 Tax=Rhizobium sp. P38BS-XIX TaxID=2726740 RepID=UPI001456C88E|nr:SDR family NAD(P)-dependent oxidoreductase [Rhizobium sp. P38BS-XIX]NLS01111.1 SDR family oxidoreductase [Rhizobium sp. P38BS-XIX]